MGARDTAGSVAGRISEARSNPYVRKVIEDEELRANVLSAIAAARSAYGRVNNGKTPSRALLDDKKLHRDLKHAAESLKTAADSLREAPKPKRRRGRMLVLVVLSAGVALALSEGLRTKVLDAMFGKEEEFDYTSTTSPNPAPDPEPASTA
jgi:hypothetical protein